MTLESIHERNARVEADKAWEMSWTRRLIIAAGTYAIASLYFNFLDVQPAWLHGIVPPGAYLISTMSFPLIKTVWIQKIYNKEVAE